MKRRRFGAFSAVPVELGEASGVVVVTPVLEGRFAK
jgi:hypothetical protein